MKEKDYNNEKLRVIYLKIPIGLEQKYCSVSVVRYKKKNKIIRAKKEIGTLRL